jgi:threonine dehydratase
MSDLWPGPLPTLHDVYRARRVIAPLLSRTPLLHAPVLDRLLQARVYVKCENLLPTGSFKVRGGLTLLSQLGPSERRRGVIAASTGNHGQSIAYGGRLLGIRVVIGAPRASNPLKVAAMRALGAEVVLEGRDFDEAREWVEETAGRDGYRYVHSANEPWLIAGVATGSLEVVEDLPEVDVVIVPIGAGSGASGHCIVAKALCPGVEVIGVQAEGAPPVYRALKEGGMASLDRIETFAEGLAARVPFALPVAILRRHLDDIVLVSDEEMKLAILLLAEAARQTVEGAGAASTAAALRLKDRLRGKTVVLVLSGGNITLETLRELFQDEARVRRAAALLREPGPPVAVSGTSVAGRAEP